MKYSNVENYILGVIMVILPYKFLGEGLTGTILTFLGALFLIFIKKKNMENDLNKIYFFELIALFLIGLISMLFTKEFILSLEGLTIYINSILFYIIFLNKREEKQQIFKGVIFGTFISSLIFIIYEGVLLHKRVGGNFGYANTYALVLIIGLYLNMIAIDKKNSWIIEVTLILGIIYTGSRNSLLYLLLYLFVKVVYNFKYEKFTTLAAPFFSIFIYFLLEYFGIVIIFILPIFIFIAYYVNCKISLKKKNCAVALVGIISLIFMFISKNEYILRVKNISFKTPVFQERLVYFEDGIKSILKNPKGHGINSFQYRQYMEQSAFYDVKYIHNSILQRGYDIGILGMIIFIAIAVYGVYILFKSKDEHKKYYIPLYISIFLHSLLDFDFAYSSIFIFVVMIIAFVKQDKVTEKPKDVKHKKYKYTFVSALLIVFSCYLILVNSITLIGNRYELTDNFERAINTYKLGEKLTLKNSKAYLALSQIYNKKYMSFRNKEDLKKCIEYLKKAEYINPYDPRITGNLAFTYERLEDEENTIKYYDKFLSKEKFYKDIYLMYFNFLNLKYKETCRQYYKIKMEDAKKLYRKNYEKLNPKAKYMKDQMDDKIIM